ncbi:MAG: alkaline phosphatase family protein [Candidatus Omnitrophota bacterium]
MDNITVKSSSEIKTNPRRISRRLFLLLLVVILAGYLFFHRKPSRLESKKKFIILGFDGADPRLVEQWWDELPNLRKLSEQGTYSRLRTCTPPESPVAWACFAIGANPGKHGVYDFLRRPVGSYMPTEESFVGREFPKFVFHSIPVKMPKAVSRRGGVAFWDVLSAAGAPTAMLEVPTTFPPPKLNYGHTLSGLGVPDARGVQATFHRFIYNSNEPEKPLDTTFGGKIEILKKEGDVFKGKIWGPYDPITDQDIREKEKKLLEYDLSWCEWQAHLHTLKGLNHVSDQERSKLASRLGNWVIQSLALHPYLHTNGIGERISILKKSLDNNEPYVKEKGAEADIARENLAEAFKSAGDLRNQIGSMARPIWANPAFRIIDDKTVEIRIRDQVKTAEINKWSDWFRLEFPVTKFIVVHAICRFYPQQLSPDNVSIFMSSPDIDPTNPAVPISHPSKFSNQLVDWTGGLYKTRGWAAETHGLKDGHLSEEGFMDDLLDIMKKREAKTFSTWSKTDPNVFVSVFSETDRVSHMFIHHIDEKHPMYNPAEAEKYKNEIKRVFIRMDEIAGRMMKEIENDPDAVLMVMSDHGFQSWRHQVNINKWLVDHGFMTIVGGQLENNEMKLEDLMKKDQDSYFRYVDWPKTQAYALGLGQIYINLKGREPLGAVVPADYDKVCDRIKEELSQLKDDRPGMEGESVVSFVAKRDEIWKGKYANDAHDAPDIQVLFNEHYRVSWQTCLGGISPVVLESNMEKWSGCHCSFDPKHVPGILFCNRKIKANDPSIFDFAPTVLRYFDLKVPEEVEGKDLFSA